MACFQLAAVILVAVLIPGTTTNKRFKRIVGGRQAAVPPEDDPVVFVYLNDHGAKVYGTRDRPDGYYNFRGIRYAEPPVGRFRFQRPRKLRLVGDVNATTAGPPCPQPDPQNSGVIGSEDCLFLNVFTPKLPDGNENLPVLMWIHGGGYRRGSASQYGVRHLVNKELVVVTIQYRLGSLGFLSVGVKELPGNVGLFDMALALEWITDYISFFGGNPNRITVFGQGTGASSAVLLSLSKITQGFLGGVIAMSGSALSAFAIDYNPLETGRELAKQNGCPETPVLEMVKCLQEIPVSTLIQADSGLQELRLAAQGVLAGITGLLGPAPCIEGGNDGRFLPNFNTESPLDGLQVGNFPSIPLLVGVTKDETAPALFELIGRLFNRTDELTQNVAVKYFPFLQGNPSVIIKSIVEATGDALFNLPAFQMAKLWSKHVGKTFFYSFEHMLKQNKHGSKEFLTGLPLVENDDVEGGVGHGDDLPFIFEPESLDGNTSFSGLALPDYNDQKVQDIVTNFIAEFARTGEPRILDDGEQPPWPAFSEENNNFVTITSKPSPHGNFRFCQMALWGGIFPRLQSATCETLWGITKFSEDALTVIDRAVQQGVGHEAIVSTVVNNTLSGNIGKGIILNSVLNNTLPANHGIQVGNGVILNATMNETTLGKSGNIIRGGVPLNAWPVAAPHGVKGIKSETNSSANIHENYVIPVTESNTDTLTSRTQSPPALFPALTGKPLRNRTTLLSGIISRPIIG